MRLTLFNISIFSRSFLYDGLLKKGKDKQNC